MLHICKHGAERKFNISVKCGLSVLFKSCFEVSLRFGQVITLFRRCERRYRGTFLDYLRKRVFGTRWIENVARKHRVKFKRCRNACRQHLFEKRFCVVRDYFFAVHRFQRIFVKFKQRNAVFCPDRNHISVADNEKPFVRKTGCFRNRRNLDFRRFCFLFCVGDGRRGAFVQPVQFDYSFKVIFSEQGKKLALVHLRGEYVFFRDVKQVAFSDYSTEFS